jgi:hypothetical protein
MEVYMKIQKVKLWQKSMLIVLALVIPVSALMIGVYNRANGQGFNNGDNTSQLAVQETLLQRQAVDDYRTKSRLAQGMLLRLQERDFVSIGYEEFLNEFIVQSQSTLDALYNIASIVEKSTYVSKDTVMFLENLQEQMRFLGIPQESERETRASYKDNHWIKILFVTVGYHLSPYLCDVIATVAMTAGAISTVVAILTKETGIGGAIAVAIASILDFVTAYFELGAKHKGMDIYFIPLLLVPTL